MAIGTAAAVTARDLLAYPAEAYLRRKHALWSFVVLMKEMASLGKGIANREGFLLKMY
jgi:hypothetical protein